MNDSKTGSGWRRETITEVLGVSKNATKDEIKKAYRNRLSSIILTKIRATGK